MERLKPVAMQHQQEALLVLTGAQVLSRGHHRRVYIHPGNPQLVVKVAKEGRANIQSRFEEKYYKHLQARGVSLEHVAACFGPVATDLGPGLALARVWLDQSKQDGSLNLAEAIERGVLTAGQIEKALNELSHYLFSRNILWTDENPENISVCLQPEIRFMIVDGLGGRDGRLLKYLLLLWVPLLARYYTLSKIRRLRARVADLQDQARHAEVSRRSG
jgi:hypothetical protein